MEEHVSHAQVIQELRMQIGTALLIHVPLMKLSLSQETAPNVQQVLNQMPRVNNANELHQNVHHEKSFQVINYIALAALISPELKTSTRTVLPMHVIQIKLLQ